MKELNKYIHDNTTLFDEEPNIGHFERFQQKQVRHRKQTVLMWGISVAASIAVMVSLGIVLQHTDRSPGTVLLCGNTPNIRGCYIEQMNAAADKIEILVQGFNQWDRQEVMNDVQSIIDSSSSGNFERELPNELSDEAMRAILADYYHRNLQGLERIVQSLNSQQAP